jgi:hypothetical protein
MAPHCEADTVIGRGVGCCARCGFDLERVPERRGRTEEGGRGSWDDGVVVRAETEIGEGTVVGCGAENRWTKGAAGDGSRSGIMNVESERVNG